ncbi:hypothetical protein [Desulfosporosinus burensis]
MTISGRAYRHTAAHYAYSCSVDWPSVPEAHENTVFARITLLADTVFARIILLAGRREGTRGSASPQKLCGLYRLSMNSFTPVREASFGVCGFFGYFLDIFWLFSGY